MAVDNGYTADGALIASVELLGATEARTDQFIEQALARLRAIPGVSAAGAGAMIPLMRQTAVTGFKVPESIARSKPTEGRALVYWVTPGYAESLGLRLQEGRFFVEGDERAGTLATIVNQEFLYASTSRTRDRWTQDSKARRAARRCHRGDRRGRGQRPEGWQRSAAAAWALLRPRIARSTHQRVGESRHSHDAHDVRRAIRRRWRVTSGQSCERSNGGRCGSDRAVDDHPGRIARRAAVRGYRDDRLRRRSNGAGRGWLYGALSYAVSQRVRELAIRAALGARRADLVRLVLRKAFR